MNIGKKRVLITGGAGFIGHAIIEHLLITLEEGLKETIMWYSANSEWGQI